MKEKEQLNRISALKLGDLKRSIKHNQLKPLKPPGDTESSVASAQSPGNSKDGRDSIGRKQPPLYKRNTSRKSLAPLGSNVKKTPKTSSAVKETRFNAKKMSKPPPGGIRINGPARNSTMGLDSDDGSL